MKRRYRSLLKRWLKKTNRKPLVIRGARQVGKSTLVRHFAESEGLQLLEVNLERHPQFEGIAATLDPEQILLEIATITGFTINDPSESLIFLDEIQACPQMLQALRYFYEDMPSLPVVAAGSLLEFALADYPFPMPVGRIEYFQMGPVSWEEFLAALGEEQLLDLLKNYEIGSYFPIAGHNRLLARLRDYLIVGGMPEAVQLFVDKQDEETIFEAQEAIVGTYRTDFSKYANGSELVRLERVLDYLGHGVGRKVKYVNIDSESRSREVRSALDLIQKAGVVLRVNHSSGDGIPLAAQSSPKTFKLYCLDIGLLNRINSLGRLRKAELQEDRFVNEGQLAEQFLAQQLYFKDTPSRRPSLHYWLREGKANNAEVDFLIQNGNTILPVEVKSGKSGTVRSLLLFGEQKNSPLLCRFDLNLPSLEPARENRAPFLSLPLYLCGQLDRLTRGLLE